ncbi:hypothetical protein FRB99_004357, partial [Tulasnella sp. 403]
EVSFAQLARSKPAKSTKASPAPAKSTKASPAPAKTEVIQSKKPTPSATPSIPGSPSPHPPGRYVPDIETVALSEPPPKPPAPPSIHASALEEDLPPTTDGVTEVPQERVATPEAPPVVDDSSFTPREDEDDPAVAETSAEATTLANWQSTNTAAPEKGEDANQAWWELAESPSPTAEDSEQPMLSRKPSFQGHTKTSTSASPSIANTEMPAAPPVPSGDFTPTTSEEVVIPSDVAQPSEHTTPPPPPAIPSIKVDRPAATPEPLATYSPAIRTPVLPPGGSPDASHTRVLSPNVHTSRSEVLSPYKQNTVSGELEEATLQVEIALANVKVEEAKVQVAQTKYDLQEARMQLLEKKLAIARRAHAAASQSVRGV